MTEPDAFTIDTRAVQDEPFPGRETEYRVLLEQRAYESIMAHGQTDLTNEVCGVLLGRPCRDGNGPFLIVTDIVRGKHAKESQEAVTLTHSTWEHVFAEIDKPEHAGKQIVGWYHMHPGFGVFLSEVDVFAQRHFFNAPWQIALVVDQQTPKVGVFFWKDSQVVRAKRFWIGDAPNWDIPGPETHRSARQGANEGKPQETLAESSRAGRWIGPWDGPALSVLTACVALVLFGILSFQVQNIRRTNDRLNAVVQNALSESAQQSFQNSAALARLLAVRARALLDNRTQPATLAGMFQEIVRLDPINKSAYGEYLPELVACLPLEQGRASGAGKPAEANDPNGP